MSYLEWLTQVHIVIYYFDALLTYLPVDAYLKRELDESFARKEQHEQLFKSTIQTREELLGYRIEAALGDIDAIELLRKEWESEAKELEKEHAERCEHEKRQQNNARSHTVSLIFHSCTFLINYLLVFTIGIQIRKRPCF